ncbi:MAG: FAD-dependent oxidoreductase, partial [Bradyrhizobium sp.]
MATDAKSLIVVGQGAAGLAAAVSAAEEAVRRRLRIDITLVEKAREDEAGGNSRWSPSNIRMEAPDRIAPDFVEEICRQSQGHAEPAYFRALEGNAAETIGWLQARGIEFATPLYYLSAGPTRIQPLGGGGAIVERLARAAREAGVEIRYESPATGLVLSADRRVRGIELRSGDETTCLDADAVVLACGGFQASTAMMRAQFGPPADGIRLISPGTRFSTGDGIRMATDIGARTSGDWTGMHIEPIDPRSARSAPVVLVYPYGIVVDRNGRRFFDEGKGLVHETWEAFARDIHFARPQRIAYAILDSLLFAIEGFERAIRSDIPPYRSDTIEGLALQIGVMPSDLRHTVDAFNVAASGDARRFDAARCDGLATVGL